MKCLVRIGAGAASLVIALLPAAVAAQEPTGGQLAVTEIYIVRAGDTLSEIAKRFDTSVAALVQANGIFDAGLISAGQRIAVPAAKARPPTAAAVVIAPARAPPLPAAAARRTRQFHATAIGRSAMGTALAVRCTGSGERVVLLVGGIHTGYEANSAILVAQLEAAARAGTMAVPHGIWLCFLPALNPDGIELGIHTNARGVDLNRNWPTADWDPIAYHPATGTVPGGGVPLSEPETRALYEFIEAARPDLVIAWHCCAYLVEANRLPTARRLGRHYAALMGLEYIEKWTAYRITGEFIRSLDEIGIAAIDVELPAPGYPAVAEHLAAVESLLAQLAPR